MVRTIVGIDWGYTNPGVMQAWCLDGDARMYLVREIYYSHRLINWWEEQARELHKQYDVEAFVCDPSEPAYINQLKNAGLNAVAANNDIAPGIQAVQQRLKIAGDGRPRLFIARDALVERDPLLEEAKKPCCTAEEITGYVWPKGGDGKIVKEKPVDIDNHGCDAMRYTTMYVDVPSGKLVLSQNPFY